MATNNSTSLTFQTRGLSTVELICRRLRRVDEAKGGKTSTNADAKVIQKQDAPHSLFAQLSMKITGQPSDPTEKTSFSVELIIETELQFTAEAPEPDSLSSEMVNSIFEPLFFTALERCRLNIWQMGYNGVRLPIKPINFNEIPKTSNTLKKIIKKRPPKSKNAE